MKQEPEIHVYSVAPTADVFARYGQEVVLFGKIHTSSGERQDHELTEPQAEELKVAGWSVHKTQKKTEQEQSRADAKEAEKLAKKEVKAETKVEAKVEAG